MELTILAVTFTVFLLLGVPVAFAIGLSSVATIVAAGLPIAIVFQKMVGGMQVFSFLAIPFFVFAGELMLYGGIADRIVIGNSAKTRCNSRSMFARDAESPIESVRGAGYRFRRAPDHEPGHKYRQQHKH